MHHVVKLMYLHGNPIANSGKVKLDRDAAMLAQYRKGKALSEIAHEFGISVQRVHQVLHGK